MTTYRFTRVNPVPVEGCTTPVPVYENGTLTGRDRSVDLGPSDRCSHDVRERIAGRAYLPYHGTGSVKEPFYKVLFQFLSVSTVGTMDSRFDYSIR